MGALLHVPSETRGLIIGSNFRLLPVLMCRRNEGSGEHSLFAFAMSTDDRHTCFDCHNALLPAQHRVYCRVLHIHVTFHTAPVWAYSSLHVLSSVAFPSRYLS